MLLKEPTNMLLKELINGQGMCGVVLKPCFSCLFWWQYVFFLLSLRRLAIQGGVSFVSHVQIRVLSCSTFVLHLLVFSGIFTPFYDDQFYIFFLSFNYFYLAHTSYYLLVGIFISCVMIIYKSIYLGPYFILTDLFTSCIMIIHEPIYHGP